MSLGATYGFFGRRPYFGLPPVSDVSRAVIGSPWKASKGRERSSQRKRRASRGQTAGLPGRASIEAVPKEEFEPVHHPETDGALRVFRIASGKGRAHFPERRDDGFRTDPAASGHLHGGETRLAAA